MSKIAILKSNGQITGVYVSPDLIDLIETIDYDHELSSYDEAVEEAIDSKFLVPIDNSFIPNGK